MNKSTLKHSVDTHANTLSNVNEDNHIIDPEIGIYAISDGMGGAGLGTLASQLAITLLPQFLHATSLAYYKKWLPLKPEHNLALNFLGKDAPLDIDSTSEKITKSGDLFILLSSGIMSSLSNDQILEIVQKNSSNINSLSKNFISLSSQKNPHVDHTALILTI